MTGSAASVRLVGSGRVIARNGRVEVYPPDAVSGPWRRPRASIVSRGTEARQIRTSGVEPHELGYMGIFAADGGSELSVAPVPHGAYLSAAHPRAVKAPADVPLSAVVASRFQLMSALSLAAPLKAVDLSDITVAVVGTGAVAVGAVHELIRRGSSSVTVIHRPGRVARVLPDGVAVRSTTDVDGVFDLVVDAVGHDLEASAALVRNGGTLGLLGTPPDTATLTALTIHRRGVQVSGMHELVGYDHEHYQRVFATICDWTHTSLDGLYLEALVQVVEPTDYEHLLKAPQPGPVLGVLQWE